MQTMTSILSYSHLFFALLVLVCPIIAQVLLRHPFDAATAKRLQHIDLVNGVAATAVLVIGLVRVFYFSKGVDYYFHNLPFIAKMVLYAIASGLSLPATLEIKRWREPLKLGSLPTVGEQKLRDLRIFIGWQAACVLGMLVCATLAARGVGSFS